MINTNTCIIFLFLIIIISQINSTYTLSKYCSASTVVNTEFRVKFDECTRSKNYVNNNDTKKNHEELLSLLDKVTEVIKAENSTKEETKRLLLDLVRIVTIVNYDGTTKSCMRSQVCSLFKNCELPMEIQYSDWSNDAIVAARIAALLTSWSHNEKISNTVFLNKLAIYSLLKSAIADNSNIYDAKIIFKLSNSSERFAFEAYKDVANKSKKRIYLMFDEYQFLFLF